MKKEEEKGKNRLMRKTYIKGALLGALLTFLIMSLGACALNFPMFKRKSDSVMDAETAEKIKKLEGLVDTYYLGEQNGNDLREGIYKGYIAGLNDPYSVYYDEEETKQLMETTEGEYDGIGAALTQNRDTGIITVSQVYKESPAEKSGMKEEDILYKVNGQEVTGEDLNAVVAEIRGKQGTTVEITVLRGENAKEIDMEVTRERVEYQTVDYRMMEDHVGYLRIREFDNVTYNQFMNAIAELESQGMEKIIYDLRGNPGGNLDIVCRILDEILPEGLIVYTEDRDGYREEETSDEERQQKYPMVLLVNGYSASASEIFAGAFQDYELGTIVGTKTFGKGVVQQILDLKDGTSVKLTISEYFTPKGRSINGIGIEPDVVVEYEKDESDEDADNQLDKAFDIIKKEK